MSIRVSQFKYYLLQKTQRIEPYRNCALKSINTLYNKNPTLFMRDNIFTFSSAWLFLLHTAFWTTQLELIFQ